MSFFSIRDAIADDCEDIMALINELASFENMRDKVQVTAERLREDGFGPDTFFKCIVAEAKIKEDEKLTVVGYALYFFIYSTFEGRSSFLEDLYVKKDYRGQGIGTALWKHVAKEAVNKRCTRMDFAVLSWNADATKVYKKQGAVDISERDHWHLWRLEEDALKQFASAT